MTVVEAIAAAEALLPGEAAPEGEVDPRWQAVIAIGEFVETEPDAVWPLIARWGCSPDEDLRMAIATCLLEHLLEHHFDAVIDRVEVLARKDKYFLDTVASCARFGQAQERSRAARLHKIWADRTRLMRRARDAARRPSADGRRC